jgi:proteasome lid subunit RPN8/RPN11
MGLRIQDSSFCQVIERRLLGIGDEPVSGDEMVFEEIKYREPVRLLRPDRDRHYACLSYHVPAQADLPIFLDHRTADAMERHALSDTSVELGGILLGKECVDEVTGAPFVWITQSLEAKHYANTQASFTYTHDSWEEISRERDQRYPDLDIVGWYHTHPSFGIFLSHHDLFIHQHFFVQPLQVAYVVDPIQQTRGFFQWRDRNMAQVEGFYLTAERGDRIALAKLANDLENFPSPQAHGGAFLSPRLEAELIKMLTRTTSPQYVSSPGDRVQTAMTFAMLGTFLGMLAVLAALGLYQIHGQVQEQRDTLKALAGSVEQVAGDQRLAMETLLEKAGIDTPAQFRERLEHAGKARDAARKQVAAQQAINETLGARTKQLELESARLASDLEAARKTQDKYETDAKEAPALREQISVLEKAEVKLKRDLEQKNAVVDTVEGKKVDEMLRSLNLFRTVTAILGVTSAALTAAVGYLYMRSLDERDPGLPVSQTETHRIT